MATRTTDHGSEELSVLRMDYARMLRRAREAFDRRDVSEGLRLLQMAAVFERDFAQKAEGGDSSAGEAGV